MTGLRGSGSRRPGRRTIGGRAREAALLDAVYEAALAPELWPRVLEGLADLVGGHATNMTRLDVHTGVGTGMSVRVDPSAMGTYFEHYAPLNPFTAGPADEPGWTPTVYRDDAVLDREAYVRTEYFNDFIAGIEAEWSVVIRLQRAAGQVSTIHMSRPQAKGRFSDPELAALRRLQPHLIRAYALAARLGAAEAEAETLRRALDGAAQAVFSTDGAGRIRGLNSAGERLLAGGALRAVGGRLAGTTAAADARLAGLIATAAQPRGADAAGGSLALPVPGRPLPLSVTVTPLRSPGEPLFGARAAVLVTVQDPNTRVTASDEQLKALYGLTPAEMRVARRLAEGANLRLVAAEQDVSINTVRVQLAALFSKTGVNRQTDLVRLLLSTL